MADSLEGRTLDEQVRNFVKPGLDEHEKRIPYYDHCYDVYRATGKSNAVVEPWQSKARIKYAMYNLDTALVNIVGGAPRARVLPRSAADADKAKAFQSILDYYIDRANIAAFQPHVTQQALIYGVTVGKTSWRYEEREQDRRVFFDNPLDPHTPRADIQRQKTIIYDGPWLEPWNIYDAWWDPFARDVNTAAYVVLRSFPSKHDLEASRHLYKNLDELYRTGEATDRAMTAQEKRMQSERNLKGRFELWEIWTDDRLIVLGNKQVVLRDEPNPHWHGRKPVLIASTRPDMFKINGIPETELIDDIQESLWTLQRMRTDNLHMTVQRGITYREGGVPDPNLLVMRPRFRWPVTDHDDVMFQAPQPLPPEAYQEESSLIAQMETVTGISPYVTGNIPSSVSHTTATSVSLLQGAATRLLQFKAQCLNANYWQPAFEMWGQDVQQFMTEPLETRIVQDGQVNFVKYHPWQVAGAYDFRVIGADESASKDQEKQAAVQLLQSLAPFAMMINVKPLIERVAMAFDFPDPEALVQAVQQQQQMAPSPQPGGGMPQQGMQGGNGLASLPPNVQAAIQKGGMGLG